MEDSMPTDLARKLAEALYQSGFVDPRFTPEYLEPIAALLDRAGLAEEVAEVARLNRAIGLWTDRWNAATEEASRYLKERDRYRAALELPLLFHGGGVWDDAKRLRWADLTGNREATTKVLCDAIREALRNE